MKTLLLMGLLLMSGTLFAQQPIEIKVWPNGAPNDNGITEEKNGDTDSPSYTKEAILYVYNPQIQISAESETKRSIFREKDKTKRSKKESAQHSKSRNKSFVMTSVSAL